MRAHELSGGIFKSTFPTRDHDTDILRDQTIGIGSEPNCNMIRHVFSPGYDRLIPSLRPIHSSHKPMSHNPNLRRWRSHININGRGVANTPVRNWGFSV